MINSGKEGINLGQLFAARYSTCSLSALELVRTKEKIVEKTVLTATVSLYNDLADSGFKIGVELKVQINDVNNKKARELVEKAHQVVLIRSRLHGCRTQNSVIAKKKQ